MGFQFIHVECYARSPGKGKQGGHDIRSILAEAGREAGAHPHVEHPSPPVLLHGVSLQYLESAAHEYADKARDGIGRKLRVDAPVLLAGVISAPPDFTGDQWDDLKALSLEALKERYEDRLQTVVEHTDEARKHIHFYAVPRPGERFDQVHTGRGAKAVAEARAKEQGLPKAAVTKAGNTAYAEEMRTFQRWFHDRVGSRLGLTLLGPKRRRLTRTEWRAEQSAAEATAKVRADAAQTIAKAEIAREAAQDAQAKASETVQLADQKRMKLKREHAIVQKGRESLQQEQRRWSTWSGRVGAVFGWLADAVSGRARRLKRQLNAQEQAHQEAMRRANEDAAIKSRIDREAAVSRLRKERDLLAADVRHLRAKAEREAHQQQVLDRAAAKARMRHR